MKRADILKKGTNTDSAVKQIIFNKLVPLAAVICLLFSGGAGALPLRAVYAGTALAFPSDFISSFLKTDEAKPAVSSEKTQGEVQNQNAPVQTESTGGNSEPFSVPEDVAQLMVEAERKYADSAHDGDINEADYSKQNATAMLGGIYIKNATSKTDLDFSDYADRQAQLCVDKSKPAVLIYHTHTSESYELLDKGYYTNERSVRSGSESENMIRIGEEVCRVLTAAGYTVIHDKTVYDSQYSGAYERSRENVIKFLKENPSIQLALDIHRGSIYLKDGSRIKQVFNYNSQKISQITVITGCEDGNVTDFPNWEKNLTIALKLQSRLAADCPGSVTPLLFCSRKYNLDIMPGALQIEIGTDANTLLESVFAARILGESIVKLLNESEV